MSVLGKKRVELLEAFPTELSVVFAKDTELEMDVLSVGLASIPEIPCIVLVDTARRPELYFVIKSVSPDLVVSCSIEAMGRDF